MGKHGGNKLGIQKKLSIIVPVYNVEVFLEECLQSLVNQTLGMTEIIIVNDGSTDDSCIIIEEYEKKYENIIVINQKNQGLAAARNSGIKVATGKYIAFIDSDDFIDLDMFEQMYLKAEKYNVEVVICDLLLYWDKDKTKIYNELNVDENKVYSSGEIYKLLLSRKLNCQTVNKIYRRDIWIKNNIWFEDGRYYEDIKPSFIIGDKYSKFMFVNKPMYKYRMREGAITANSSPKKILDFVEMVEECCKYSKKNYSNIDSFDKYFMSFNISYGLYAMEMLRSISDKAKQNELKILIEDKINLDYNLIQCYKNETISLKSKIKYLLFKLGLY